MPPPFNRSDSARFAAVAALALAILAACGAAGLGWHGAGVADAAVAGGCSGLLLAAVVTWRLPGDLPLRRLHGEERLRAAGPPPPGTARLRVARGRAFLTFGRMDLVLDGRQIGQLRPGMVFVTAIPPGPHVFSARVWLRRIAFREQINALPGTDSDFSIGGSGSRLTKYGIDRHGVGAVLQDRRTVVLGAAADQER